VTPAWVLIDASNGAKTHDGGSLTPALIDVIVAAVSAQVNGEFAQEHGGSATIRRGTSSTDILPGERVLLFVASFPSLPQDSAYHDDGPGGSPRAFVAVTTCDSVLGPGGICQDVSHEILEAQADEGANKWADDGSGTLHAFEVCDGVEVQSYLSGAAYVCNFVLRAWFIPGAPGPYDYMATAGLSAIRPPGPLKTAPGQGGNYQILRTGGGTRTAFAMRGTSRKMMRGGLPRRLQHITPVTEITYEAGRLAHVHVGEGAPSAAQQIAAAIDERQKKSVAAAAVQPLPIRIHCPSCHELHVDEGEFATRPHRTHQCRTCGMRWEPANVPTVGVRFLPDD
jgi:hypothetical protein